MTDTNLDARPAAAALSTLLPAVPGVIRSPEGDPQVSGLALDSRQVQKGDIFVALTGGSTDGHNYIPDAVRRGAAAVVGTRPGVDAGVPYVQVEDTRLAMAYLAAALHDFPARRLTVIGVTGTDGKTTTSNLIFEVLRAAGLQVGMISTVNAIIGDQTLDTGFHVTTPEAPDVQRYLWLMVNAGMTHVVLEATSHGLAQKRVAACDIDLAVVTNITHEHLDYHGSYEGYRDAKAELFRDVLRSQPKPGVPRGVVLNRDDIAFDFLNELTAAAPDKGIRRVVYGLDANAEIYARDVRSGKDGIHFTALGPGFEIPVHCRLEGLYNVSNCLAAIGAGLALGVPVEAAQRGIASLAGVPGRMERLDLGQPFTAIVDFAHTPYALENALKTARVMAGEQGGRVIAVFGSAGLRDRIKRRMMAETSARLADISVLTAEDPRTESLADILEEMARGAQSQGGVEGETFFRVPDRREAIRFAVRCARPGDIVIACGKGHEQSMCFGETEYLWDDRTAMRAALAELLGVPGPEMPYLPDPN